MDKVRATLDLVFDLATSSTGLTIEDIRISRGVSRSTAERMRDLVDEMFGPLERRRDGKTVRFRLHLPKGLNFVTAPTVAEMSELMSVARAAKAHEPARADRLESLAGKVLVALRPADRRRMEPDIDARLENEVWHHTPHPSAVRHDVLEAIRHAMLTGRAINIICHCPSHGTPTTHKVVPFGLVLGDPAYLVAAAVGESVPYLLHLERIAEVLELDEEGHRPADFDLRSFTERTIGTNTDGSNRASAGSRPDVSAGHTL
ncbi:WYL domain-containing protein [Azorhizobium oxalatiphilum]|uniref:WYL domain-containing protein n=1 Tax=Azorhizobium oxalatiphilum TaxID=980631 RepID=UPI001662AB09